MQCWSLSSSHATAQRAVRHTMPRVLHVLITEFVPGWAVLQLVLMQAVPLRSPCCLRRYTTQRVDVVGVRCYSSVDLEHWKDEGG